MSTVNHTISYVFRWVGIIDERSCKKCRRLIGREWRDQDLFQHVLWDPFEGDIFDLDAGVPLTHPNCRCTVTVEIIVDEPKLTEYLGIDELGMNLEEALGI